MEVCTLQLESCSHLPQLEKAWAWQWKFSTAKNEYIDKNSSLLEPWSWFLEQDMGRTLSETSNPLVHQWDAPWTYQRQGLMLLGSPVPGMGLGAQGTPHDWRRGALLCGPLLQHASPTSPCWPRSLLLFLRDKASLPSSKYLFSWLPEKMDTWGVSISQEFTKYWLN